MIDSQLNMSDQLQLNQVSFLVEPPLLLRKLTLPQSMIHKSESSELSTSPVYSSPPSRHRGHYGKNDYEINALSTGPFAVSFARLLAPLTHLLALHCSLHSRTPLRLFVCLLAHWLIPKPMGKQWIDVYELNASIPYNFNPKCVTDSVIPIAFP